MGLAGDLAVGYREHYFRKQFGVKNWLPCIRDMTFPTIVLDISFGEAEQIYRACREFNRVQLAKQRKRSNESMATYFTGLGRTNERDVEDDAMKLLKNSLLLLRLAERINDKLSAGPFRMRPFMAKLDTRSPKDALLYNPGVKAYQEIMKGELDKIPVESFLLRNSDSNKRLALEVVKTSIRAQNLALRLKDGKEVISVFIRSFRIMEDLFSAMRYGEDHFDTQIILREWDSWTTEHPGAEFRCFVHNGSLNASTQYFTSCFYPSLVRRQKEISKAIQEFFNKRVSPALAQKYDSYVVDLLVRWQETKAGDLIRMQVIEVNPFEKFTGAGMFNWRRDRNTLLKGPFQLRVVKSQPSTGYDHFVAKRWQPFIKSHISRRKLKWDLAIGGLVASMVGAAFALMLLPTLDETSKDSRKKM